MTTTPLHPDRDRVINALQRLAGVDQRSHVWQLPENLVIEAAVLLMTPGTSPADVYRFLTDQGHKPGGLSGWYRFVRAFRRQYLLALDELSDLHALPVAEVAGRLHVTLQAVEGLVRTGKLTKYSLPLNRGQIHAARAGGHLARTLSSELALQLNG